MDDMKNDTIITTNEKHIEYLIEKARQGNAVRMLGMGNSMRPLLEGGRDYIDLIFVNNDTQLKKNDIVFYLSHEGKYVLHRIYSVSEDGYCLNGDGNLELEPLLSRERIYLKAVGFVRKGRYVSIDSKCYQCYVHMWTRLLPCRVHLLRWYNCRRRLISMLMKEEKKMVIKEDLMLRNIEGEWIVIPMGERLLEFNGMMRVNESGAFIWRLLESNKTKRQIVEAMIEEYDVDEETASKEVDTFIKSLKEVDILGE